MSGPTDAGTGPALPIRVADNASDRRYEAFLGDDLAGFVTYRWIAGRLVFVHTEVPPAFAGRGVAAALARFGLDDARSRGLRVRALCPYVAAFIERHPDYRDLLAEDPSPAS